MTYARWLSETQIRFDGAAPTLRTLGLFTVTRSFGFRTLLVLLAGCLLLRLTESADQLQQHRRIVKPIARWRSLAHTHLPEAMDGLRRRRYRVLSDPDVEPPLFQADRWPWADSFPLLAHTGALLLLIGLLAAHLWGWRVEGLIVQGGEQVTLSGTEKWVALDKSAYNVTHSPGIATFVEERRAGVAVTAFDSAGNPLSLQRPSRTDPVTQLTVTLIEDQYFAIPEAQLVIRLAARPDHTPEARSLVLVQVYRSPPGRLTAEAMVESDAELTADGVMIKLTSVPYAQLAATFNPGLWPSCAGLVLLIAGLLGSVVWPARRCWLREHEGKIEAAGDIPTALATNEES